MTTQPGLKLPNFARNKKIPNNPNGPNGFPVIGSVVPIVQIATPPITLRTPAIGIVNNVIPNTIPRPPTPLVIPNIGTVKKEPVTPSQVLQIGENPWLRNKVPGSSDIKITSITPIGTIPMVPTCDKRPRTPRRIPPTPGKQLTLRVVDENTGQPIVDPILTTTIYLDCTKPEDQDYNYVSERMRAITANTVNLQKQYSNEYRPLINVNGLVSPQTFEEALTIYENNQVYYQDCLDDHKLDLPKGLKVLPVGDTEYLLPRGNLPANRLKIDLPNIKAGLTSLEHWFMFIIEPRSTDDIESWREREKCKVLNGISAYCDPELHQHIQPLPQNSRELIRQYHHGLHLN